MSSLRGTLRHASLVIAGFTALYMVYFLPVFAAGKQLLGVDGLHFHYPAVYSEWSCWDPYSYSGHPRFGDPQHQLWYPLARLAALADSLWNAYILSAYVLGSSFCYGLSYRLTRSKLAGATTGIVYGLSAFLMLHQPHVTILHAAAWAPLIFWAIEELRTRIHPGWVAVLGMATVNCFLAGHPQIFIYALLAAGVFTLVTLPAAPAGWWRYGLAVMIGTSLGIAAAMIQLLPTYELSTYCARERISFDMFASYSLPGKQWPQLVFPVVYGSDLATSFASDPNSQAVTPLLPVPCISKWFCTEIGISPGTIGLLLALIGFGLSLRARVTWAWLLLALASLVYALGDSTPIGEWLYRVPVLNKFRCPGRFAFVWYLAVAVLAGMGIARLRESSIPYQKVRVALATALIALLVGAAWWTVHEQMATEELFAKARGLAPKVPAWSSSSNPWQNLAIALPLGLFVAGTLLVWCLRSRPARVPTVLLLLVLVADVGQASWAGGLCYVATSGPELGRSLPARFLERQPEFLRNRERFLTPTDSCLSHNLHTLLKVPNAGGYSQLKLSRYDRLLQHYPLRGSQLPRLTSVRYFVDALVPWCHSGVEWNEKEFPGRIIGSTSFPEAVPQVGYSIRPVPVTRVALMTYLGYGVDIAQGERVAELRLTTDSGEVHVLPVLAGVHTAEVAWERPDIRDRVRHRLPGMTFSVPDNSGTPAPYRIHLSVGVLDLPRPVKVQRLEAVWVGPGTAFLKVLRVTLIEERQAEPRDRFRPLREEHGWEVVDYLPGQRRLVRNPAKQLHRAWLVQQACVLPPETMPGVILDQARLPDGSTFDPDRTALVETPVQLDGAPPDPEAEAQIVRDTPHRVEVRTSSRARSVLVLGDAYYPCWTARIDGHRAPVFPVDYILRGVVVPPGEHRVHFSFRSRTLEIGKWVSLAALLSLATLLAVAWGLPRNAAKLVWPLLTANRIGSFL